MAYVIKNTETGITHGVTAERFGDLKGREGYEVVEATEGASLAETDLPEDFPALEHLRKDGRFSMEADLRSATDDDLDSVDGIGPATIDDIDSALEALQGKGEE